MCVSVCVCVRVRERTTISDDGARAQWEQIVCEVKVEALPQAVLLLRTGDVTVGEAERTACDGVCVCVFRRE